jgi:hypothetical protein
VFAVDHAATALLVKRRYPSVPIAPILISVQAMEFAWVGLNYLGIERTTTNDTVRSVADIQLVYMPYSHSVGTAVGAAVLVWLILDKGFGRALLGRALGLGIVSHLILDLATHGHDIVLWPGLATPKLGLGLYAAAPVAAFFVELLYGVFCWYVYRGGRGLLAFITLGNLANLSTLSPEIPGPEQYLAGRPTLLVSFIFVQIVVSLVFVGVLARRRTATSTALPPMGRQILAEHHESRDRGLHARETSASIAAEGVERSTPLSRQKPEIAAARRMISASYARHQAPPSRGPMTRWNGVPLTMPTGGVLVFSPPPGCSSPSECSDVTMST